MLNVKSSIVAQRLLNLYRQEHVIIGGWAAINPIFVADATDDVMAALNELPTGKSLVRHIQNLRAGVTPMDSIEHDLLPYGGAMSNAGDTTPPDTAEWHELVDAINAFTPDQTGLNMIMNTPAVKKFGPEWIVAVRAMLGNRSDLLQKWDTISQTYKAYTAWERAGQILNTPISDRVRAQLQADMPEYETYLPMFGTAGDDLLVKLRTFVSSIKPNAIQQNQTFDTLSDATASPDVSASSSDVR